MNDFANNGNIGVCSVGPVMLMCNTPVSIHSLEEECKLRGAWLALLYVLL